MLRFELPLGLALLVAGGALGLVSDSARATPRPAPGPSSLLGGFSALAVQVLWIRADDALLRGEHAEALLNLDLISQLEPQLVQGAEYIAHEIGFNVAADTIDREAAWGLMHEGLRVHERCVAGSPGVAAARVNRAGYLIARFGRDPALAARFATETGRSPYEAALEDLRAALAADGTDLEAWELRAVAALWAGREHLTAGRLTAADELLAEAEEALVETTRRYRAGGLETPELAQSLEFARALRLVLAAPEAERAARYAEFHALHVVPGGLRGFPDPGDFPRR